MAEDYITCERYEESPEIMLEVGDVLVAKDGSTLGIVNVVRHLPAPTTVNSSIAVIRPHTRLDSVYLYYFITAPYIQSVIRQMKEGQGVPHLFQEDMRRFRILLPPLDEQRAIAGYLDRETAKLDALIATTRRHIALLGERRTALIAAAVMGRIAAPSPVIVRMPLDT